MATRGTREAIKELAALSKRLDYASKLATQRMALKAEQQMKKGIIRKVNDGHRRPDGRYTDAKIGSPPMTRTGDLYASIDGSKVERVGFGSYKAEVGPRVHYAKALELGLSNGATYPTVTPAAEKLLKSRALEKIYLNVMKAAFRK